MSSIITGGADNNVHNTGSSSLTSPAGVPKFTTQDKSVSHTRVERSSVIIASSGSDIGHHPNIVPSAKDDLGEDNNVR